MPRCPYETALSTSLFLSPQEQKLHPLNDRCSSHAGADAQRHQRGCEVAALKLVNRGAEDHCASRAERMPHGDRAAVDVDLGGIELEGLQIAQHHRREGL